MVSPSPRGHLPYCTVHRPRNTTTEKRRLRIDPRITRNIPPYEPLPGDPFTKDPGPRDRHRPLPFVSSRPFQGVQCDQLAHPKTPHFFFKDISIKVTYYWSIHRHSLLTLCTLHCAYPYTACFIVI